MMPLTMSQVATTCESPWELAEYSPVGRYRYLLLDAASVPVAAATLATMCAVLRRLPCPVIAMGEVFDETLLQGVDVIVTNEQEARSVIATVNAQPFAAMSLVQLLRHNAHSTPEQGLWAESWAYGTLQASRPVQGPENDQTVASAAHSLPVLAERQGDVLQVTLNRPAVRNAYSAAMRDALYEALLLLKMDASLRKAVVSGEGSCFCIGGDLNEFGLAAEPAVAHAIRSTRNVAALLLSVSDRLEFRLHRACIGAGIELPAFAAQVLAERNAFVQLPEVRLGLLPGAGGTVSIPQRIGRHRTAYLALSGRRINAETAYAWGLIDGFL
ncbi:MAG: enoyl-CoA hydratase/isomerase family protein [Halioglobus sp.]|nr:enoyl-CoA hydratase/isomerase family protein [Halioglobus sp.]